MVTIKSGRWAIYGCFSVGLAGCTEAAGRGVGGPGLADGQDAGGECVTPFGDPCEVPECDDPCGFNDPNPANEGACVITGVPQQCDDVRGVTVLFQQLGATVPAPGGVFKSSDPMLEKWVKARWQEQADFVIPANVETTLTAGGVKVWNYPDGNGWIRADFHGGIMALPQGKTPQQLLREMANDIGAVTGNDEFAAWVAWPASNDRKVGDRVDLDIWGPDNGAVGYWKIDPDRFCVVTLQNDTAGWHPVNGIRCFGFVPMAINPNWTLLPENDAKWSCGGPTYMFYTIGLDSPSVAGGGAGAPAQAATWNAMIRDLLQENDKAGGVSGRYYQQITVAQPNALKPKSGVQVTGPGNRDSHYCPLPSDGQREGQFCEDPGGAAGGAAGCEVGQYTCSDGTCLPGEQRCDGTAQCDDRGDEDACDQPDQNGCPANQFACNDGQCIPDDWRCDGQYEDCSAGEDEENCEASEMACKGDQFTCGDGKCIAATWKCDAITDCADASDEAMCGGTGEGEGGSCAASQFACNDGQCIAASWECDGYNDCSAAEDESDCADDGGSGPAETCEGYACSNGQCIAASWECDGIIDCTDGGDETGCSGGAGGNEPPTNSCGLDQYACGDGTCIPASYECDIYVDCAGGEDEASC